jgi:hypothetical protein
MDLDGCCAILYLFNWMRKSKWSRISRAHPLRSARCRPAAAAADAGLPCDLIPPRPLRREPQASAACVGAGVICTDFGAAVHEQGGGGGGDSFGKRSPPVASCGR